MQYDPAIHPASTPATKAPKLDRTPLACPRCGGKFMLHFEVKEMWRSPYRNTPPMYGAAGQFRAYCADCLGQVFPEGKILTSLEVVSPDIKAIFDEMKGLLDQIQKEAKTESVPPPGIYPEVQIYEAIQKDLDAMQKDIAALKAPRGGRKKK